jgi:excisionase family DNA binding protein
LNDRWLSLAEIAACLGVSKDLVYRWVETRHLPAHKIGRRWKFKVAEVDAWVLSRKANFMTEPVAPRERLRAACPIGLQAVLSTHDGATWDFQSDHIVNEGKTPWSLPQGGGFGNTLQLKDGRLLSCYSYRGADHQTYVEVVRWQLPEAKERTK